LKCGDGTLYTGITNDLARRIRQHNDGSASRYTRSRLPVKLIYDEPCPGRSQALKKEFAVKSLSRQEKEEYMMNAKCRMQKAKVKRNGHKAMS
jgi:predicted GIY-YIG superfamily endonuclease